MQSAATNTSLFKLGERLVAALDSAISWRSYRSENMLGKFIWWRKKRGEKIKWKMNIQKSESSITVISSMSMVISTKPAWVIREAMSWGCTNGEMWAPMPPNRSISANCREMRSSLMVSPARRPPMKALSGRRTLKSVGLKLMVRNWLKIEFH